MAHKPAWDVVADALNLRAQQLIDDVWEGSMSETKAEYYAKHLQRLQEQVIVDEQVELIQPTGLPELLARMVTEFQVGLGEQTGELHEKLAEQFTIVLLRAAHPLLTDYLTKLANPPMVVKWDDYMLEHPEAYKPVSRDEELLKTLSYRTYLMALPADETALPYREWVATK